MYFYLFKIQILCKREFYIKSIKWVVLTSARYYSHGSCCLLETDESEPSRNCEVTVRTVLTLTLVASGPGSVHHSLSPPATGRTRVTTLQVQLTGIRLPSPIQETVGTLPRCPPPGVSQLRSILPLGDTNHHMISHSLLPTIFIKYLELVLKPTFLFSKKISSNLQPLREII